MEEAKRIKNRLKEIVRSVENLQKEKVDLQDLLEEHRKDKQKSQNSLLSKSS
jgi:hypothetical protein